MEYITNLKYKTIKFLIENREGNLYEFGCGVEFFGYKTNMIVHEKKNRTPIS